MCPIRSQCCTNKDAPTGALNSTNTNNVLNVMTELNNEGQSIVMVTHDIKTARRGNRILYLRDGVVENECNLGKYVTNDPDRHQKLRDFLVIRFSIASNMEDNLPNIGISEALGYTTGQLIRSSLIEYLIITITGLIIGFSLAGVCSGYVAGIISGSIGLVWHPAIDITVVFLTIIFTFILVLSTVLIMSRKFKKITPLDALRVGISTHNFKRNPLPLKKRNPGLQNTLG